MKSFKVKERVKKSKRNKIAIIIGIIIIGLLINNAITNNSVPNEIHDIEHLKEVE
jgi:hypothetical protein